MALLFFEGFDNKEPQGRGGFGLSSPITYFGPGRMGTGFCASSVTTNDVVRLTVPLDLPTIGTDEIVWSVAHKIEAGSNFDVRFFAIQQTSGVNLSVGLNTTTRQIRATGNGFDVTGNFFAELGKWHRFDVEAKLTATAGAGYLRVYADGNLVLERTATATISGTYGTVTGVSAQFGRYGSSTTYSVDDVYLLSKVGAAPYNARLGDVRVETLRPVADAGVQTTPFGVANSWEAVAELPADGATSYNIADVNGERDLFQVSPLDIGGQVFAVQQYYQARKTDSGNTFIKPVMAEGASVRVSPQVGVQTDFGYVAGPIQTTHPDGSAWTPASVMAARYGYEAGIS